MRNENQKESSNYYINDVFYIDIHHSSLLTDELFRYLPRGNFITVMNFIMTILLTFVLPSHRLERL